MHFYSGSSNRGSVECSLERLELDMCGRGFGDPAVAALCASASGRLPGLRVLSLGGAYRLSDAGLVTLLRAAPGLEEVHLAQCCRVEGDALQQLPELAGELRCRHVWVQGHRITAGNAKGPLG